VARSKEKHKKLKIFMERVKATPESYARKIDFIEKAMAEGAHLRLPRAKGCRQAYVQRACEIRIVDIGLLYHAGPETTGPSIAAMYHVTGEAIRQTRNRFIVDLYKNSSKETRQKFPLDSIALSSLLLCLRERKWPNNGRIKLKVRSLIGEGVTDSEVIISRLETTRARLKAATKSGMFKEWGLTLPVENINRSFKEVEGKVESMTDDRQLQEILDSFSDSSLRGFTPKKHYQAYLRQS